jgi:transcriptional regulator with XRE-family HTH domain
MNLGEKLRHMREIEGTIRGMGREMTQLEVVHAIKKELGKTISQSYLSQIESGRRPHLTNKTRLLLARFFKVHPGHLVDDPEGYHSELISDLRVAEDRLDVWIVEGAERFTRDKELHHSLLTLAQHPDSRKCLLLLHNILETPGLFERLSEVLNSSPERKNNPAPSSTTSLSAKRRRER